MPSRPPALILSGLAATAVIALTSSMAHRPALTAALTGSATARLPAPLWLVILAAMLLTYGLGLGIGWLLWGRKAG